jgi:hypothetical protein
VYIAADSGVLSVIDANSGAKLHEHDFGDVILSTPVIDSGEGILYICSNEKPAVDCTQSQGTVLSALNADDLSLLYEYPTSPPPATLSVLPIWSASSPAVTVDMIYFGSIDGMLYSFLKSDPTAPEFQHKYDTGSRIYSTPVIVNGKVLFMTSGGKVVSLYKDNLSEDWSFQTPRVTDICLPVALSVSNGKVFAPSTYGTLHVLNLDTGAEEWSYDVYAKCGSIPHSTTIADGKVFITTAPPPWLPGTVMKLLVIGEELNGESEVIEYTDYTLQTGSAGMISSPPISADSKIFTAAGGTLFAFNLDGTLDWTMENVGKVYGAPAVEGSTLYTGSGNGFVYSFDTTEQSDSPSSDTEDTTDEYPSGGIKLAPVFSYSDTDYDSDEKTFASAGKNSGMLYASSQAEEDYPGRFARAFLWEHYTWSGTDNTDMTAYATIRLEKTTTDTEFTASARLHVWLRVEDLDGGDTVSALMFKKTEASTTLDLGAWKSSEKHLHCPLSFRAKKDHTYKIEVWGEAHSSAYAEQQGDYTQWGNAQSELECYVEDLRLTMTEMPFIDVEVVNGSLSIHDTYDIWEDSIYDTTGDRYGVGYFKIKVSAGYYDHNASWVRVKVPVSEILECNLGNLSLESSDDHLFKFRLPPAEDLELRGDTWFTIPYLVVDGEISGPQFAVIGGIGQVGKGTVQEIIDNLPPYDPNSPDLYAPIPYIGDLYTPDPYIKPELGVFAEVDGVEIYPSGVQALDFSQLDMGHLYDKDFLQLNRAITVPGWGVPLYQYKEEDRVTVEGYVYNGGFTDTGQDVHKFNVVFDVIPRSEAWSVEEPNWAPDY